MYKVNEKITDEKYEKALLYFESSMIDGNITREKQFMEAIKDGWEPIIQTRSHINDWFYYEFLMKRRIKEIL